MQSLLHRLQLLNFNAELPIPSARAVVAAADAASAAIAAAIALVVVVGAAKSCRLSKDDRYLHNHHHHHQQQQQQQQQHPTACDSYPEETLAILRFINKPSSPPPSPAHAHAVARDVLYVHGVHRGVGYKGDGEMIVTVGVGECRQRQL